MDCNITRQNTRPLFRLNPWFDDFFKEFGTSGRGVTLRPALDVRRRAKLERRLGRGVGL